MYSTLWSRLTACLIATTFLVLSSGGVLAQAGGAMPPPAVSVIQLQARPVQVVAKLKGKNYKPIRWAFARTVALEP
jgi:hypothetical protein